MKENLHNLKKQGLFSVGLAFALLLTSVLAGNCYDESYMPMPLTSNDGSGDMEYLTITGCPAKGYIYMGGFTMSATSIYGRNPPHPVLTQVDLLQNTYAYRRSFTMNQYGDIHAISALALSPDCANIALHMTSLFGSSAQGPVSYVLVVKANDAHYITPMVRIVHGAAGVGTHTVMTDGIIFD